MSKNSNTHQLPPPDLVERLKAQSWTGLVHHQDFSGSVKGTEASIILIASRQLMQETQSPGVPENSDREPLLKAPGPPQKALLPAKWSRWKVGATGHKVTGHMLLV